MTTEKKEWLTYSDHAKPRTRPSELIAGLEIDDGDTLACPRCKKWECDGLSHQQSVVCPECHLRMKRLGNALEISDGGEGGPMSERKIVRVVPFDDPLVQRDADYVRLLERLGRPEVVEDENGVFRFRRNKLCRWVCDREPGGGGLSLNDIAAAYARGRFTLDEYMGFYMGLGYSLCGFVEVFGEDLWPDEGEG